MYDSKVVIMPSPNHYSHISWYRCWQVEGWTISSIFRLLSGGNTQIHQNTVFFSGRFFDHVLPLTDRDEGVTAPFEADGSLSLVNMAATYAGDIYGVNDLVRKSDHIHWDEDVNWLYLTCGTIYIYIHMYIHACVCVCFGWGRHRWDLVKWC